MKNLSKIRFDSKVKNWLLTDSPYVITTDEINEIKDVVNLLIDEVANVFTFADVCKWAIIKVPKQPSQKILRIDIADNESFANSQSYYSTFENVDAYLFISGNGAFMKIDHIFPDMEGEIVLVDIAGLGIETPERKNFIRYGFVSSTSENARLYGSSIGAFGPVKDAEDSVPMQMADEDQDDDLVDVIFSRSSELSYSIVLKYEDGSERSFNAQTMHADLSTFNEENPIVFSASGDTISIDERSFTSSGQKFIFIKIVDDLGKSIVKPLIVTAAR